MTSPLDALRGLEGLASRRAPGQPRPAVPGFADLFALSLDDLLADAGDADPADDLAVEGLDDFDSDEARGVTLASAARTTIDDRGLTWDEPLARQVASTVDELQLRGSHHALVFTASQAFRIDVHERTVTEACTRSEALARILADLDTTVVLDSDR